MGHKLIFDADDLCVCKTDSYEHVCACINTLCHYFVMKHSDFVGVEFEDGEVYKVKCRETGETDFKYTWETTE